MRIRIGGVTRFGSPTRSIGIDSIAAPLEEVGPSETAGISPSPTSSDLHSSGVAPKIDGICNVSDTVITLAKLVGYGVVNLTTSPLGPVIFSAANTKLYFRLSTPASAA